MHWTLASPKPGQNGPTGSPLDTLRGMEWRAAWLCGAGGLCSKEGSWGLKGDSFSTGSWPAFLCIVWRAPVLGAEGKGLFFRDPHMSKPFPHKSYPQPCPPFSHLAPWGTREP